MTRIKLVWRLFSAFIFDCRDLTGGLLYGSGDNLLIDAVSEN